MMKDLRDKSMMTKFLILYKSAVDQPTKLAEISDDLEMSEQAVSNYISELEENDLLDRSRSSYHPTSQGMELVRDIISDLGSFLDEASENINFISTCTAIASENIEEGERIGLYMEDGFLHASMRESTSMGTAISNAEEGEPVKVGGLQGITEIELGEVHLVRSDLDDDAKERADLLQDKIEKEGLEYDKIAIMDELQYGLCNIIGLKPDLKFAPVESTINAAEKGLDVLLLLSRSDMDEVLEKLNTRNRDLDEEYRIDYSVL